MRKISETLQRQHEGWSRQEFALMGAFFAGCVIFVFAFAYALGIGRDSIQTADASLIPPAMMGERVPMIPVPR